MSKAASARGLFRATGAPPRTSVITGEEVAGPERESDDFYPTPPEPSRALLAAEAVRLKDFRLIWEPAVGDGAMAREIRAAGHACYGTDLVQRGAAEEVIDFFAAAKAPAQAIVTNPPFNAVNWRDGRGRWIEHAMGTLGVDYMALLLSWNWPGVAGLGQVWAKWPPARVYLMRWRIDFTGQGTPPMLNGWFVWDRAHGGETILRMMDRGADARQEALF